MIDLRVQQHKEYRVVSKIFKITLRCHYYDPASPIIRLSNHPNLVGILPILLENPESRLTCDRNRKIPILTFVLNFQMNSYDKYTRTSNRVYLTVMSC